MESKNLQEKALRTLETKTPPKGGVFVMPAFSFGHTLAERGFRPQAHYDYSSLGMNYQ